MKNGISLFLILSLCTCMSCNQSVTDRNDAHLVDSSSSSQDKMDVNKAGQNRKIVEDAFNDWAVGKGNFFDLLDENVVWRVTGKAPFSGVYRGKQEFMEKAVTPINDFLSTSIKPELIDVHASGATVWLQWKGTATAKNGGQYINEYAWKLTFSDKGKVTAADAFLDTYSLSKLVER